MLDAAGCRCCRPVGRARAAPVRPLSSLASPTTVTPCWLTTSARPATACCYVRLARAANASFSTCEGGDRDLLGRGMCRSERMGVFTNRSR